MLLSFRVLILRIYYCGLMIHIYVYVLASLLILKSGIHVYQIPARLIRGMVKRENSSK